MEKDIKKFTTGLKMFPKGTYQDFDLDRLAAYTLFTLENNKVPLYFDYIAVALFKLFPDKFSMASFKQYPDTNRIGKALRRLTDIKRKNWATGSVENGFYITEAGREVAKQVEKVLTSPELKKVDLPQMKKRSRGRDLKEEVEEIEQSAVFKKWVEKDFSITEYEVFSLLNAVPYTPKSLLFQYLEQLKQSAGTVKNKKVLEFLNWLEEKHGHIFH